MILVCYGKQDHGSTLLVYISFKTSVYPRLLRYYLTLEVSLRSISGSANCLFSPLSLEMPAASRRASSLAWVS